MHGFTALTMQENMERYDLPVGFKPPFLTLPRQQTAVVQGSDGQATIGHDAALPVPEPHMVLVRTAAVSINPCDWKMPSKFPTPGARIGCDFSGTVIAIGPDAGSKLRLGDRICGGIHGSNPIDPASGCFSQYVAAHADLLFKLPEHTTWESGAVLGGSVIATLSIALCKCLKLTATPDKTRLSHVLVYGGSYVEIEQRGTLSFRLPGVQRASRLPGHTEWTVAAIRWWGSGICRIQGDIFQRHPRGRRRWRCRKCSPWCLPRVSYHSR